MLDDVHRATHRLRQLKKVNKIIRLILWHEITQVNETIVRVRISTISLDQTIHINLGKQDPQITISITLGQAIGPTALETRIARGVQVDHRLGHLVVVEDKIND